MLFKLLVSAVLTAACLMGLHAATADVPGTTRMFLYAAIALVAGHHRNIVPREGGIEWLKVHAPTGERARIIESVWGVPLSSGRTVRVSARARGVTEKTPGWSVFAELWPTPIRALWRKALVRRNGR